MTVRVYLQHSTVADREDTEHIDNGVDNRSSDEQSVVFFNSMERFRPRSTCNSKHPAGFEYTNGANYRTILSSQVCLLTPGATNGAQEL